LSTPAPVVGTFLAADTPVPVRKPGLHPVPVAASVQIFQGSCCCVDSNGNAQLAGDQVGYVYAGIAEFEGANNSSGTAGAISVMLNDAMQVHVGGSGFTQASVGLIAYWISDCQVQTASTTNSIIAGKIVQFISSTEVIVDPRIRN
jgi:hypothetical protein